jgi:DHA2 family multidrug resistance protein
VQVNHANISAYVTPLNPAFNNAAVMHAYNPYTAMGRAAIDGVITLQSTIIAYTDDFWLLMVLSLGVIPLVLLFKKASKPAEIDHSAVME